MRTTKKILLASAAAIAAAMTAVAQVPSHPVEFSTPGIVMAGSVNTDALPDKAKDFIAKYFPGVAVTKCEHYYAKGEYSVELSTSVDIDFDLKGNVTEVEAPDMSVLPRSLVKDLLHDTAFARLIADGYADKVESIEFKRGRVVEVSVNKQDPDTYVFDLNGVFIALED